LALPFIIKCTRQTGQTHFFYLNMPQLDSLTYFLNTFG
jgi:hypothetical protein